MTDSRSADIPVAIDRVDCTRSDADGIELRLTGRWTSGGEIAGSEPLLVVQVQGRRHRFAPDRDGYTPPPGSWAATFQLPSWARPRQEGQAALWVGTSVVPVPLPGTVPGGDPRLAVPDGVQRLRVLDGVPRVPSALHAELEQRSAEVARLQGSLADAQSELEARSSRQSALESAHGDLRDELQELVSAVVAQRDDYERRHSEAEERLAGAKAERDASLAELSALRDQLAAAEVSREAATGEVAGLRVELERLGSELAVMREHLSAQGGDLGDAQQLLAEARGLSEQLRSGRPPKAAPGTAGGAR